MSLRDFFQKKGSAGNESDTGAIGFHLAKDKLHMMQLEKHRGGLCLRAGRSVSYPGDRDALLESPADFKAFVKQELKAGNFKSNEIVTCLPGGVKIINLSYQIEAGQKIEDEIVKSIIYSLGGVPEDYIIDYLPIRSENLTSREKSVLVFVVSRAKMIHFLDVLSGAGLQVKAVDVGPSCLGRLMSSLDHKKNYPHNLLINFAANRSFLSVFDGRRLMMDRSLPLGLNHLLEILAKNLGLDNEQAMAMLTRYGFQARNEAADNNDSGLNEQEIVASILEIVKPFFHEIADELNKMLLFTKSETRGKIIEHIYLLGCFVRFPGAEQFISEFFSIPVSVLDPLAHIDIKEGRAHYIHLDGPAQIALSMGFALRGMI